jgi:dual specificity phosphatase 12
VLRHLFPSHSFIDDAIASGGSVLIHCQAGVSRSVTVAASYLMKQQKISCEAALEMIRLKRPSAKPIRYFVEQLKLFEQVLKTIE